MEAQLAVQLRALPHTAAAERGWVSLSCDTSVATLELIGFASSTARHVARRLWSARSLSWHTVFGIRGAVFGARMLTSLAASHNIRLDSPGNDRIEDWDTVQLVARAARADQTALAAGDRRRSARIRAAQARAEQQRADEEARQAATAAAAAEQAAARRARRSTASARQQNHLPAVATAADRRRERARATRAREHEERINGPGLTRHEVAALRQAGPQQHGERKTAYLKRIKTAWMALEMADPGDSTLEESKRAQDGINDFHTDIQNIRFRRCTQCDVRPLVMAATAPPPGFLCDVCAADLADGRPFLRSHANFYKPHPQPLALVNLTIVEELFISRIWAVVNVFKARGGQDMYGGHVICFPRAQQVRGINQQLSSVLSPRLTHHVTRTPTPTVCQRRDQRSAAPARRTRFRLRGVWYIGPGDPRAQGCGPGGHQVQDRPRWVGRRGAGRGAACVAA